MEEVKDMTELEQENQTTTNLVENVLPIEEKPIDYLEACDLTSISRRVWDGSYVVMRNGLPYHVPDTEEYKDFFAQLDEYAVEHPAAVTEEHPYVPTEEELAAAELAKAKAERAAAVASITVEVDGMVFDGDEQAQERMSRTITAATATGASMEDKTTWVLYDNTVAQVTIMQLAQALRKAGEAQTALWTIPYTNAA